METEMVGSSGITLHKIPAFEMFECAITLDPTHTIEQWVEAANGSWNVNPGFDTNSMGKFLRNHGTRPTTDTIVFFRPGKGKDGDLEWGEGVRRLLKLDPVGFEHMAAIAVAFSIEIWAPHEQTWVFTPDIQWFDGDGARFILGLCGRKFGPRCTNIFTGTRYTNFDGTVWFCGVKRRS